MSRLKPTLRERLAALMDEMEPAFRVAFQESIRDIVSNIRLAAIVERMETHDIDGAIRALHIEEAAFSPLHGAIQEAFDKGGGATIANMPKLRDREGGEVIVRWNVRDLEAERNIRELSSRLITSVTEDTKEAARQVMERGMAVGSHPNTMALDIAGRVNRVSGNRENGIIGLSSVQEVYAATAEAELSSGDPEQMRNYLARKRRDKGPGGVIDRTVLKAIDSGTKLPRDFVVRAKAGYIRKMLQLRAETIAQTETVEAVEASQHEAFRQSLNKLGYPEQAITREWQNSGLPNIRDSHIALDGEKVVGLSTPFVSPLTGARMRFPGDRSLGAPAKELIGCRCHQSIKIDFSWGLK